MWRKVSNLLKKDPKTHEHDHAEPVPALVPGQPRRPQALNLNRAGNPKPGPFPARPEDNAIPNRPTSSRPMAVLAQGRVRCFAPDHAKSLQNTWQLPVAEITIDEDTDRVTRNENPQYHQHVFLFENSTAAATAVGGGVVGGDPGMPSASLPEQNGWSSWRNGPGAEQTSKRRKPIPNFTGPMDPPPPQQQQQAAAASVFPEAAVPPTPQGIGSQSATFGDRLPGVASDVCGGGRRSYSSLHDYERDSESQGSNTTIPSVCLQDESGRRSIGRVRKMQGRSLASANFGGSRRGSVDDGSYGFELNLHSGPHSLTASTTQLLSNSGQGPADGPGFSLLVSGQNSGPQPPQASPASPLLRTPSSGMRPPPPPPLPPPSLESLHLAAIQRQKRTFYDRTGGMSSKARTPQHTSRSMTPTKSYGVSSTPQSSSTTPKRAPPPSRQSIGSGRAAPFESSGKRVRSDSYKQVPFPAAHHVPLGSSSSCAGTHLAARETRSVPSLTSSSSSSARPFRSNPLGSVNSSASGSMVSVAPGFFGSESSQLDFIDANDGGQALSPSVFSADSYQSDDDRPESPDGAYASGPFSDSGNGEVGVAAVGRKGSLLNTENSIMEGSGSDSNVSAPCRASPQQQRRSTLGPTSISRRSSETSLSSFSNASMHRRASMHELMTLTSMSPVPRMRPGESSKGSRSIQRVVIPPLRRSVSLKLLSQISDTNLANTAALSDSQFLFPSTPGLNVAPPVRSVIEISIAEAILPMSIEQHGEAEEMGAVGMYVAVGLNVNIVKRSGVVVAGPEPRWNESLFFHISDPVASGGRLVVRCVEYNFSTSRAYSAGGATIDISPLYGSHQSKMGKMWVHLSPRAHAPLPKPGVRKRKNLKTEQPLPVPLGRGASPNGSRNSLAAAAAAAANAANAAGRLCIAITHHVVNLRLQVVVDTFPIVLHCNRDDTIASLVVYAQRVAGFYAPRSDWLATRVCGEKIRPGATIGEVCQWDDLIVIGPDYTLASWYRSAGERWNDGGM